MVKLQRYRIGKQIDRMQPTIHFMEEGRKSEQVLFAGDKEEMDQIISKHRNLESEDEMLGKRAEILPDVRYFL